MKRILCTFLLIAAAFLLAPAVQATPFTFGDSVIYWATWGSGNLADDTTDAVGGAPLITGGGGMIDASGNLTSVYFNYTYTTPTIKAADLFVDFNADGFWDYVVSPGTAGSATQYQLASSISATKGVNDGAYVLSNAYFSSWPLGPGGYREFHPVEYVVQTGDIATAALYTEFDAGLAPVTFSNLSIPVAVGGFILGFGPTCANDVVQEKIPVPEPATMLLLGTGLLGLALIGRKKFIKK